MKTDVKIGIFLGIIFVVAAMIWFMDRAEQPEDEPVILPPPVAESPDEQPKSIVPKPVDSVVETLPKPEEKVVVTPPPAVQPKPEPAKPAEPAPVVTQPPAAQEPPRPEKRFHVVQKGESLYTISEQYFGHGRFWKVIYDANKNLIKDPEKLNVGVRLRIPYPEEIADVKP